MSRHYLLDENKKPYPVSIEQSLIGYTDPDMKIVQQDRVCDDTVFVSTVFLVLDHSYDDTPVLFETMVFGGKYDQYQERYHTYEEALAGHKRVLEDVLKDSCRPA